MRSEVDICFMYSCPHSRVAELNIYLETTIATISGVHISSISYVGLIHYPVVRKTAPYLTILVLHWTKDHKASLVTLPPPPLSFAYKWVKHSGERPIDNYSRLGSSGKSTLLFVHRFGSWMARAKALWTMTIIMIMTTPVYSLQVVTGSELLAYVLLPAAKK